MRRKLHQFRVRYESYGIWKQCLTCQFAGAQEGGESSCSRREAKWSHPRAEARKETKCSWAFKTKLTHHDQDRLTKEASGFRRCQTTSKGRICICLWGWDAPAMRLELKNPTALTAVIVRYHIVKSLLVSGEDWSLNELDRIRPYHHENVTIISDNNNSWHTKRTWSDRVLYLLSANV